MKIYKPMNCRFSYKAESERINLGFHPSDRRLIDQEELRPDKIQVMVRDRTTRITKDNKLEQSQYCSECRTELTLLPSTARLLCVRCGNSIELEANIPLTALGQALTPHISQLETTENQEARPFFWSLVDSDGKEENAESAKYEITYSSLDQRIQHIKMKSGVSPTEYRIFANYN
jgi:hypothetical protein